MPLNQIVDSSMLPAGTRAEAMRAVADHIIPVELDFPDTGPVVRGTLTDLGALRISSIQSNVTRVERTPRLARDDLTPSLLLGLQVSGSSLVVQDGRETVVRPGDLVVYRSTSPYALVDAGGYRQHQMRMPLDKLALPGTSYGRLPRPGSVPGTRSQTWPPSTSSTSRAGRKPSPTPGPRL